MFRRLLACILDTSRYYIHTYIIYIIYWYNIYIYTDCIHVYSLWNPYDWYILHKLMIEYWLLSSPFAGSTVLPALMFEASVTAAAPLGGEPMRVDTASCTAGSSWWKETGNKKYFTSLQQGRTPTWTLEWIMNDWFVQNPNFTQSFFN